MTGRLWRSLNISLVQAEVTIEVTIEVTKYLSCSGRGRAAESGQPRPGRRGGGAEHLPGAGDDDDDSDDDDDDDDCADHGRG